MAWNPALAKIGDALFGKGDSECSRDVETTILQLAESSCPSGSVNWSEEEESEIAASIVEFLQETMGAVEEFKALIFPTVRIFT